MKNLKLVKSQDRWDLYNPEGHKVASTLEGCKSVLSLKNCQAIERGYDLDDCVDYFEKGKLYIQQDGVIILAGENGNNGIIIKDPLETRGVGHYSDEWNPKAFCEFKQKALELMGNIKFSEEDMEKAYSLGWGNCNKFNESEPITELHDFIQSLQQTEWDVEIEIDEEKDFIFDPAMGISQGFYLDKPKLDADGCLILKLAE